nr:dORF protein [Avian coronavirus]URN97286.1 dORF protein [Vector pBAC-Beaudette-FU]BDI54774.1 dORF protein [Avian coronavirus]BDI54800.1 dORF protein [synthetic construct]
MDLLFPGTFC